MNPAWLNALEKLAKEGALPSSAIPASIRSELERWGERSGCLAMERQGRGSVLRVIRLDMLEIELRKWRPMESSQDLTNRAANLARYRDTKTGESRQDCTYVLAKAFGNDLSAMINGVPISLYKLSSVLGCLAITLQDSTVPWHCEVPLLLVENQCLFDHVQWLGDDWKGLLLYYQGNLSERLLSWLTKSAFSSITLFPDYDGIGLGNYSRLRQAVPDALWYWGKDWEKAISLFGNTALWQKDEQRRQVESLYAQWEREGYPDPLLATLIRLLREEGKMLEQEWVMIG